MCLIVFSLNMHEEYPLIMAANRDEFFQRPTLPIHKWVDEKLIAGKDLEAKGTWLGLNQKGKIAAITNYRDPKYYKPNAPSRGLLTLNFLKNNGSIDNYLDQISWNADEFNGYNLLLGDDKKMVHYSNVTKRKAEVSKGIFGLSNAVLDTPWPKVVEAKKRLEEAIQSNQLDDEHLISLLYDTSEAKKSELPKTGVDEALEKKLSAMFIRIPGYGTRCTSVIKKNKNGMWSFTEYVYDKEGKITHRNSLSLT